MSNHLGDTNKMVSDTPRTDQQNDDLLNSDSYTSWLEMSGFARQLERELNAANERIRLLIAERDTARRQADQTYKLRKEFAELLGTDDVERGVAVVRGLQERIKRLEEAGDELEDDKQALLGLMYQMGAKPERLGSVGVGSTNRWRKAKEAKP